MISRKKNFLSILTSVLSISLLSACEEYKIPKAKWTDGIIVNIGGKDYTYEEFYKLMDNSKNEAQSLYTVAKNVLAQIITPANAAIKSTVDLRLKDLENTWKTQARTNSSSYKEEKEKTLDSENVEDEEELKKKYIAQEQEKANSNEYYNINADGISDETKGYKFYISEDTTKNYVKNAAPYHVSHILIKVDAAEGGTGYWDGQITSDNAKKISNTLQRLTSTDTFGSVAHEISDDEGSQAQYGELYTSGDSPMIAMEKSTSYINEFKLGLYAYDAYLNPTTKEDDQLKASLRVPGKKIAAGDFTYENETLVKDKINNVLVGKGQAFGIPLSKAFTLGQVADLEKSQESSMPVDFSSVTNYPRNILFNTYFNYHGVNFIYDDTDTYPIEFLKESVEVIKVQDQLKKSKDPTATETEVKDSNGNKYDFTNNKFVDGSSNEITPTKEIAEDFINTSIKTSLPKKYEEYQTISSMLSKIEKSKFKEVDGISNKLFGYNEVANATNNQKYDVTLDTISDDNNKKSILVEQDLIDNTKFNPVVVVRGGSSGSYQGIHFIVVNKDPFVDANNVYKYYRTNIPKSSTTEIEADPNTRDYTKNPSFINYVQADPNTSTTYNNRRDAVYKAIKASDSDIEFKLFEYNLAKFKTKYSKDFITELGEKGSVIQRYIDLTKASSKRSSKETLDDSWEQYINALTLQEQLTPNRIMPQVCISAFEGGSLEGKEVLCHVKK